MWIYLGEKDGEGGGKDAHEPSERGRTEAVESGKGGSWIKLTKCARAGIEMAGSR